ncbi:hypothetical protein KHO57_gp006 [Mycobacterium phage Phabba]|uniref:Uncharacterized protein n=1 Tax=Mycobacterium phage Phabba TaxID=2027899 RepID=A0A249XS73_9CAUD|nr:hypothetical protein KHO57_gp006 [Mycobacterium phage Phabba]ASZ74581.1 hypothetical protein SEA_PHABBA_6 [Mycobacterium phage Phabba]
MLEDPAVKALRERVELLERQVKELLDHQHEHQDSTSFGSMTRVTSTPRLAAVRGEDGQLRRAP